MNELTQSIKDLSQGKDVVANDRAYVFHSWSAQGKLNPLPVAGGKGSVFGIMMEINTWIFHHNWSMSIWGTSILN